MRAAPPGFDLRDPALRPAFALAALAAPLATVPIVVTAFVLERVLARATTALELGFALAVVALAFALRVVCARAAARHVRRLMTERVERLRVEVLERLPLLPAKTLRTIDPGRMVALLTTGLDETIGVAGDAFEAIVGGAGTAFLVLLLLASVDWRIALVAFAFFPVSVIYLWRSRKISARATPRLARARAEGTSRFFEYVESVALLRAFGRSAERAKRLVWALQELKVKAFETSIAPIPFGIIALFFIEFGFAITIMVATEANAGNGFSPARYVLGLVVALGYFQTLFDAVDVYLRLRDADANVRELGFALESTAAVPVARAGALSGHALVVDGVSFAFDRGPVLEDISYRFGESGVIAVVGRSGAGKSALAGVLSGLHDPTAGSVSIGGVDLRTLSDDARSSLVTLVFQDTALFDDTIWNNIAAGRPGATDDEVRAAARTAHCEDFIARLPAGYDSILPLGGRSLSLGERQRLAIARALLSRSPIVVFDECTASLDPSAERAVHRAIDELAQRSTVVLITHRLGTARFAPEIVVMAHGRIVESGTHDTLLAQAGEYARLWSAYESARAWHAAAG